jgi:hypothetical protein
MFKGIERGPKRKEKKTNQQTLHSRGQESQSPSKQLVWNASFNVSGVVVAYIFKNKKHVAPTTHIRG